VSTSSMIYLLCVFAVWKGIYGPICIFGNILAQIGKNSLRNFKTSTKITGNKAQNHKINDASISTHFI